MKGLTSGVAGWWLGQNRHSIDTATGGLPDARAATYLLPLDVSDVRVLQTDITQAREVILTVESTLESTTCHRCGRTITDLHGTDKPHLLRHLPILGRPLYLRIRPMRFHCPYCDDHPTKQSHIGYML